MLRDTAKRALRRAGRTRLGKEAIHAAVLEDPGLARYERVREWPQTLDGFEDLAFLFSSNQLNHGIASLQLDEAAHLYSVVRRLGRATIAEIGRFKGGSTLIIAAAMAPGSELYSYDVHAPLDAPYTGADLDRELREALARFELDGAVHLLVTDSRTAELPARPCDLLFIDGDHSYEGVLADWRHWRGHVAAGGHVLFHDAVDYGGFGVFCEGVVRLVREIETNERGEFTRVEGAGAIAHFVRSP